jgi:hypothetical protein
MYPVEWMVEERLALLVKKGWLFEKNGFYTCAPKTRLLARSAKLFQQIYKLEVSG